LAEENRRSDTATVTGRDDKTYPKASGAKSRRLGPTPYHRDA
jgi:hypothetical protein